MHGWLGNVDRLVRQVGYVPDTPEDMEIRQMEIDGPEALLSMPAFRSLNPTQGCFERKLFFFEFFFMICCTCASIESSFVDHYFYLRFCFYARGCIYCA
mmetsp:Transcript_24613/g.27384  ORF Transcript_24613/g.27384 Transcript_24613/m.27384 type:complete len:99 (-) Transcript_24613:829-1125(-)